jgi:uncharacterized membrane protein YbhN (UPF0104 family)
MKKLQVILLVGGLGLLVYLVNAVGFSVIAHQLSLVGWYSLGVIAISGTKYVVRTWAWMLAADESHRSLSFSEMFQVRLAGEGVGYLASGGPLFGEPTKVLLLKEKISVASSLSSVMLERIIYTITGLVFITSSIPLSLWRFTSASESTKAFQLVFILVIAALLWLLYVTVKNQWRVFTASLDLLKKLPFNLQALTRKEADIRAMEDHLYLFHRKHPGRFLAILGLDLFSHVFTVLEIYLILSLIGVPITLVDSYLIEAYTKVLEAATIIIPAGIGTFEGGNAMILQLLSLGAAPGVSLALIRRVRSLFWAALGLLVLLRYSLRSTPAGWNQARVVGESNSGH